jgi:hypothetical protein
MPYARKGCKHLSNLRPFFAEDILLIFLPLPKNILAEIRHLIQQRVGKIKKEWSRNDRHFYGVTFFVNPKQARHIESENMPNVFFPQSLIGVALPLKRNMFAVELYSEKSWFCVVFGSEDDNGCQILIARPV